MVQGADQPRFKHGQVAKGLEVAMDEIYDPGTHERQPIEACTSVEMLCQVADARKEKHGHEGQPVLYPAGSDHKQYNAHVATPAILARIKPDANPHQIATAAGLRWNREIDPLEGYAQFEAKTPAQALLKLEALEHTEGVESATIVFAQWMETKNLLNDPLFPLQWHLLNTFSTTLDANIDVGVTNAWERYTGKGITIGIVDSGIEFRHPDLAPGYLTNLQYDYVSNDRDPSPVDGLGEFHATAVAGCAAARGNNGLGVAGVAYNANLTGLRLIAGLPLTEDQMAGALLHSNSVIHVKNNSWGPGNGPSAILADRGPRIRDALRRSATEGRGGLGTITLFAAGNSSGTGMDANFSALGNDINVLAIGAIRDTGELCSYSEAGACLTVSAPSGDFGYRNIVTTDLSGQDGYNTGAQADEDPDVGYTRNFNGTSAACPIASGVVALLLEAKPSLRFRDVKEILLRTASVIQPAHPDWATNSAGIHHNHMFGGGLIHAQRAIDTGINWTPLGPVTNIEMTIKTGLPKQIPDNDPSGVVFEFTVTNTFFRVEDVTVTLSTTHTNWGDLEVSLISPKRVRSHLADVHVANTAFDYRNWTFSSTRHWGEPAQGVWRVQVVDAVEKDGGRVDAVSMKIYGSTPKVASFGAVRQKDSVRLALRAPAAGWKCAIDQTTDLKNWSTLNTVTIDDTGLASYVDRSGVPGSHRFYRARVVAP